MKSVAKKRFLGIILALVAVLIIGAVLWFTILRDRFGGGLGEVVYVDTLAHFMGVSPAGGSNRYAGVVESQDTWSVNANTESEDGIQDIYVEVGDEVEVGTDLFTYNTENMQDELSQANIDLKRLENEMNSLNTVLNQLDKERREAGSSEQTDYMIQIEEQKLAIQQKEIEITSKKEEIGKIEANIKNATVKSEIAGVVKSIKNNNQQASMMGGDEAFITIMRTADLRIRGTVNEQNIGELTEGTAVTIYSRVNDSTWRGTITKIDMENTVNNQNDDYYDEGSSGETSSSRYPFYVTLETSEGLMLGQHVYVSAGDPVSDVAGTLWVDEYLMDLSDADHPFVWADNGKGKLEKRRIQVGEYNAETMQYEVLSGLALTDLIAYPDENFREGMRTAEMGSMQGDEEDEEGEEGGNGENLEENIGVENEATSVSGTGEGFADEMDAVEMEDGEIGE